MMMPLKEIKWIFHCFMEDNAGCLCSLNLSILVRRRRRSLSVWVERHYSLFFDDNESNRNDTPGKSSERSRMQPFSMFSGSRQPKIGNEKKTKSFVWKRRREMERERVITEELMFDLIAGFNLPLIAFVSRLFFSPAWESLLTINGVSRNIILFYAT